VNITTRDKISALVKLTATGRSTHASRPMPESAITHLTIALAKTAAWDTSPTLIAQTREYFRALSHTAEPPLADHLRTLADSTDPAALRQAGQKVVELGSYKLLWHALMRNTVAPTMLKAGIKENVIPGTAEAILNVRLIPGSTPWEVMDQLRTVIDDPTVTVQLGGTMSEEQARHFYDERTKLAASGTGTDLYKALVDSARKAWPGAEVVSALFEAGTDASAWRSRGVPIYGIYPYPLDNETLERMHGNDERISIKSLGEGTQMIYDALAAVVRK